MKRIKQLNENIKSDGYYVKEFMLGFFGEQNEGKRMLSSMGLPNDQVPFSIVTLLQNRKIQWKDKDGNDVKISFKIKPGQIECTGSYMNNKKSARVICEWDEYEDPEVVKKLESEAIGDLCMRCIYEKMIE